MAANFLANKLISDLCIGKQLLNKSLTISSTVSDALYALKISDENCLPVWTCADLKDNNIADIDIIDIKCVGKVCMVDVICYLYACGSTIESEEGDSFFRDSLVLKEPVSVLLQQIGSGIVRHVEPDFSLLEAVDLITGGAQNLVVPIWSRQKTFTCHEFCWLSQEDVVRFILNSIAVFSPIPSLSIEFLGIIDTDILTVEYHKAASSGVEAISRALIQQTSVAVVDEESRLIGEISPVTLASCDEIVAAAITTLSAGDLMSYVDGSKPPEGMFQVVKAWLKERNLEGMLEMSSSSSLSSYSLSDEEFLPSPSSTLSLRYGRPSSYQARMIRSSEAIVCHPGSSFIAVMIQALTHHVSYAWVLKDDYYLAGIVTFSNMLKVLRAHAVDNILK